MSNKTMGDWDVLMLQYGKKENQLYKKKRSLNRKFSLNELILFKFILD